MTSVQQCLIAIGGNMPSRAGPPQQTVDAALQHLTATGARIDAVSRFYRTPAFPPGSGPDFVNAAATLRMLGDPETVLAALHRIEAAFGRERRARWGQRTLDLDLIGIDDLVRPDRAGYEVWRALDARAQQARAPDHLILPHPRAHERAFVLVPLADVAPDWRHPVLGLSVREMLEALPQEARDTVVAL
ncbi:2-amino-4-hydroxy-6-hydroxymethyldihydropteridine pyrophosphokinase [Roseovarius sp. A-2]|uniref:2-amino-4-hydroxy-6- hydroxymethyldihydropteridine diphosphokinase n=1 Tax=Roseovarius sp. A-2 TaxID=1570360 RepID=UPI0009B51D26|nr:2-amino-4-hydroxy-6-hydroxymethyldihydropteridine diphosphokinase [Roseovarius sp. A-2]GAW36874.1 2-amino-4-hydroxy-6-hydroxymethyldihydropteridine pyrophosphokinase [Roseovarius sp. A-2]